VPLIQAPNTAYAAGQSGPRGQQAASGEFFAFFSKKSQKISKKLTQIPRRRRAAFS